MKMRLPARNHARWRFYCLRRVCLHDRGRRGSIVTLGGLKLCRAKKEYTFVPSTIEVLRGLWRASGGKRHTRYSLRGKHEHTPKLIARGG